MTEFAGRVAVITGAGSGIGRALARALAARGARLVAADRDRPALADLAAELDGVELLAQPCDVVREADLEALADAAWERFGGVHYLFNNAGILAAGPLWELPAAEWRRLLDVNLMGVVHGLRAFVPRMLAARESAWIVNTASLAGLTSVPGLAAYCASKHAVVALSECLHHELARLDAPIRVAVLCPAFVPTAIAATLPAEEPWAVQVRRAVDRGRLSADEVAERALAGLAAGRFYLLPHPAGLAGVAARAEDIAAGHPPRDPTTLRPA